MAKGVQHRFWIVADRTFGRDVGFGEQQRHEKLAVTKGGDANHHLIFLIEIFLACYE